MRKLLVPASVLCLAALVAPGVPRLLAQAPKPPADAATFEVAAPRPVAQAPGPPAEDATFEVASVKTNKSGDNRIGIGFAPGGRFRATNVPLRELISAAYGTPQPLAAFQITGGPKWMESDRFDIVAKAPGDPQPGPNGPPPAMFAMLRNLLKERFQLTVHRETKEVPIYALMLARADGKLGPQLRPAATDCAALMAAARGRGGPPPPPAPGERMPCGMRMFPGNLSGGSSSMAQLTNVLARFVNRTGRRQDRPHGQLRSRPAVDAGSDAAGARRSASGRAGAAGDRSERTLDFYCRPGAAGPEARLHARVR